MIYSGLPDVSVLIVPMYKAMRPRQMRMMPTRNRMITARVAGPEHPSPKGSLRRYRPMKIQ